MESLRIEGGPPLEGSVEIDGAKNAALPACVASLLTDDPIVLHRVPCLRDVSTILYTLGSLGKCVVRSDESVSIRGSGELSIEANAYSVRQMRASFLVLGPLVARRGRAIVPLPGGCAIGRRPVDLHLRGLEALGARVIEQGGVVTVEADRLRGARIALPFPSVGATEQILLTACLADGETRIDNAAIEPEIVDLVGLLRRMGAEIELDGRTMHIVGRSRLAGAEHTLIPDRMEAGTFLIAGAITGGRVDVGPVKIAHLRPILDVLEQAGATLTETVVGLTVTAADRWRPVSATTGPHPGFPTDLHPPLVALLSLVPGSSCVRETVFEERFAYVRSLCAMGARIDKRDSELRIDGVPALRGAEVEAPDIRAGAALILAGLAAQGLTTVSHMNHVDRGYHRIEEKLTRIGATIERIET